jgi:hypothetical protein
MGPNTKRACDLNVMVGMDLGVVDWLHDPAKIRSAPLAGGRMQNGWLHDPAKNCPQLAA